jgi:hypothetical protein
VLVQDQSELNGDVVVLEFPPGAEDASEVLHGARGLLMGEPPTLQGVYRPFGTEDYLSYQYWDVFIAFPPLLPDGPLAIYGLGIGTIPRLLIESFQNPPIMYGWEADQKVLWAADTAMGLREMQASGCLQVRWLASRVRLLLWSPCAAASWALMPSTAWCCCRATTIPSSPAAAGAARPHAAPTLPPALRCMQVVREDALGASAHFTGDDAFGGIIVDMMDKRGELPFRLTQVGCRLEAMGRVPGAAPRLLLPAGSRVLHDARASVQQCRPGGASWGPAAEPAGRPAITPAWLHPPAPAARGLEDHPRAADAGWPSDGQPGRRPQAGRHPGPARHQRPQRDARGVRGRGAGVGALAG